MSKKVLILKFNKTVRAEVLQKLKDETLNTIQQCGILILNNSMDYEFGEIDGVVWDSEKTEEKEASSKWGVGYDQSADYVINYLKSTAEKEELNENLRDSEN